MTSPPRPPGPIAEEAARLLHAAQAWVRAVPLGVVHAGERGEPVACRGCPLCQVLAVVREARPETLTHLGGAVESFALAVRAALDGVGGAAAAAAGEPAAEAPETAGEAGEGGPAPRRVQHIDIA